MILCLDSELKTRFPHLKVAFALIKNVKVQKADEKLKDFILQQTEEIKKQYGHDPSSIKNIQIIETFRNLLRQTIVQRIRASSVEALIQRILKDKPFPSINNIVDAGNLAVINTGHPIGIFDADKFSGDITLRSAEKGESFIPIGSKESIEFDGGEIILSDADGLVLSIVAYRDSDKTKIINTTRNILVVILGIEKEPLLKAAQLVVNYITEFCGGEGKVELAS